MGSEQESWAIGPHTEDLIASVSLGAASAISSTDLLFSAGDWLGTSVGDLLGASVGDLCGASGGERDGEREKAPSGSVGGEDEAPRAGESGGKAQ